MSREITLGRHADLKARERMVVAVDGIEIGVFFHGEGVHAYLNRCPHMGGPACQGKIMPRTLEAVTPEGRSRGLAFSKTQRNIVCAWHGFEFDIETGEHPCNPRVKLSAVPARIVEGDVRLTVTGDKA